MADKGLFVSLLAKKLRINQKSRRIEIVHMNQPELYSENNNCLVQESVRVLDQHFNLLKWKGNESILEIGIADGKNTMENLMPRIPKPFKKFTGVDISEEMVEFAKKKYNYPNTEFLILDIATKTLPTHYKDEYDHIFSFLVMHMVKDQSCGFTNIFNMLKPGGQFLITFAIKFPLADAIEAMSRNPRWTQYIDLSSLPVYKYYELRNLKNMEDSLRKDLTEIGFEVDVCTVEKRAHKFKNFEEFKGLTVSGNWAVSKIPLEDREEFINDYINVLSANDEWFTIQDGPNNEKSISQKLDIAVILGSKPIKK